MDARILIAAAVPFCTARLQAANRSIIKRSITEVEKNRKKSKLSNPSNKTLQRLSLLSRREKNKAAAQISRERAKLKQDLLEKRLSDLKYEKMKLLLENEALRQQNQELEEENLNLKQEADDVSRTSGDEGYSLEAAIKHAWFVNIPLLKEWVVSRIFFMLLMSVCETLKLHTMYLSFQMPHFSMLQRTPQILLHLAPLPWKGVLSPLSLPNRMILNG